MARLVSATPAGDARLRLRFTDGAEGVVDLGHLVGKGVFAELADPTRFAEATIGEDGELRWGDELDLCPDALYLEVTGKRWREAFGDATLEGVDAGDGRA